jgi:hypothetical protein
MILTKRIRSLGAPVQAEHTPDFQLNCIATATGRDHGVKIMSKAEEKNPQICERCDKENAHMTKLTAPDNRVQHVCWSCLYRTEKRINVSRQWQRARRG